MVLLTVRGRNTFVESLHFDQFDSLSKAAHRTLQREVSPDGASFFLSYLIHIDPNTIVALISRPLLDRGAS